MKRLGSYIFKISCVSQCVNIDKIDIWKIFHRKIQKMRTNKTKAARDENSFFHYFLIRYTNSQYARNATGKRIIVFQDSSKKFNPKCKIVESKNPNEKMEKYFQEKNGYESDFHQASTATSDDKR